MSVISKRQWHKITKRNLIRGGIKTRLQKGHRAWNKGRKGLCFPGSEKGHFKPGHVPHNGKFLWCIVTRKDKSRQCRMIATPGPTKHRHIWIPYAKFLWEKKHGPVPRGFFVVHKDGDRLNDDIGNLVIVDRAGNLALMKKNNPKWIDKASRKHRETNRRKRAQKASELKRKEKQQLLEIKRFKKLQEQKNRDREEQKKSEQRKSEIYGPMVAFWLCNGCGRTCSDVLPPIPCPKCQSLSYERVEQREKLALAS